MDPLQYSVEVLGYILGPKPLSPEQKQRVRIIEDVNTIQLKLGKRELSPKQFDFLYDAPLNELTNFLNEQSSLLFAPPPQF